MSVIDEAGSALHTRMLAFDYGNGEVADLMRRVWSGTPWMLNVKTESPNSDQRRLIGDWCVNRFGPEAWPLHGRPGTWHVGGATVHGWTWIGFATEPMMQEFAARWPDSTEEER